MGGLFVHRWGPRVKLAVLSRAMAAWVPSNIVSAAVGGLMRFFSLKLPGFLVRANFTQFGRDWFGGFFCYYAYGCVFFEGVF